MNSRHNFFIGHKGTLSSIFRPTDIIYDSLYEMRIVLLTNGLRPVALGFPSFPGVTVGVINWDHRHTKIPDWKYTLQAWAARSRGRVYASLHHLCQRHGLV